MEKTKGFAVLKRFVVVPFTILILSFTDLKTISLVSAQPAANDHLVWDKDSIQITSHIRNYITGPIEGKMTLTKFDAVSLYAGPIPKDAPKGSINIRKWALWGDADSPESFCYLQKIYDYGKKAVFFCTLTGNYLAYAEDSVVPEKEIDKAPPANVGPIDKIENIWISRPGLAMFELSERISHRTTFWKDFLNTKREQWLMGKPLTQSDPMDIVHSEFCYYWNYRLREKARVGYVFRESEPLTGVASGGSYILVELSVWIIEPSAVSESERNTAAADDLNVAEYSKVLTRRFHAKGLLPCLRKVHPSIELVSDITFLEIDADLKSPHWRMELKVHTDTLISTISDMSFTVSSRQHVSLFHCFVGDVRAFMRNQDFDFIDSGQSDRNSINWALSVVPKTTLDYLRLKIKHIYGHGTIYVGQSMSRVYQPGDVRSDLVVINNPCVAQEFAIAFSGRIYIVEEFLVNYQKNAIDIVLPGLGDLDAEGSASSEEMQRRHGAYLPIADVAFTPTHVAILMKDSSMYIHSHSVYYKGLAYLSSTIKSRLGALVKRRWCARTGTPKTHNMLIPAFSRTGNIIIIQMFPVEGSVNMWVQDPPDSCLFKDPTLFENQLADVQQGVNETCVHRDEVVKHSDERGLDEFPDIKGCDKNENSNSSKVEKNPDELQTFLMNQDVIFDDNDDHFPRELTNVAIHKISDNSTFYNKALTYHIDHNEEEGRKLENMLRSNGFTLINQNTLHAVEFTAVEKMFIVGVEFEAKEFAGNKDTKYDFTMLITSVTTVNMPVKIYATSADKEETLETSIPFPGVILVRTVPYMVKNLTDDSKNAKGVPYTTKLFAINTAVPAYVIDLGNVYIFSSVESKYARPLTYFDRDLIHKVIRNIRRGSEKADPNIPNKLEDSQRSPTFSPKSYSCIKRDCTTPSGDLFDIVVTEQGTLSVLSRLGDGITAHRIFIGSVMTLDSLREVKPFAKTDNLFQLSTPDGEIVYGKFKSRGFSFHRNCTDSPDGGELQDIKKNGHVNETCLVPHMNTKFKPFCARTDNVPATGPVPCLSWKFVNKEKSGDPSSKLITIGLCKKKDKNPKSCVYRAEDDSGIPPNNYPTRELDSAEILGVPFSSLLNGNIQLVPEEKITGSPNANAKIKKSGVDSLCPFATFDVKYVKFDYAEIGFRTRITGVISYLGKNVPSEAELIVEYENVPGIQVSITSGVVEEKDQTTLSKTIDISVKLSDIEFRRMKSTTVRTEFRDTMNLAKEISDMFSITIRPSIINLRCSKDDFFITIQYAIGCNPFNRMRLVAEASPLIQRKIKHEGEKADELVDWVRRGDYLSVPRDDVWHKQRSGFGCDEKARKNCLIPYAYLFEDNIYDLSWRDPFVPQFEQFLRSHTRRISANVILYDLLGNQIVMNITSLAAGCYHSASSWYSTLLESTKTIGTDSTEQEDLYRYFVDCFDQSVSEREKPHALSATVYRPVNLTNNNRMLFNILGQNRTKNRNQILIFRAVVINTYYNRFTYCKLFDTFFVIRITGIPTPRQGLSFLDSTIIIVILCIFFAIIYFIFYKFYTWKLDIPAIPGADQDETEIDENQWRPQFGSVESDHMMKRLAVKVHAVAKWRQKALQNVIRRYQEDPKQQPDWAKARIEDGAGRTALTSKDN